MQPQRPFWGANATPSTGVNETQEDTGTELDLLPSTAERAEGDGREDPDISGDGQAPSGNSQAAPDREERTTGDSPTRRRSNANPPEERENVAIACLDQGTEDPVAAGPSTGDSRPRAGPSNSGAPADGDGPSSERKRKAGDSALGTASASVARGGRHPMKHKKQKTGLTKQDTVSPSAD
ncbi:MAG: hypothetical protein Q9218_000632 [Villophora microphyllina]